VLYNLQAPAYVEEPYLNNFRFNCFITNTDYLVITYLCADYSVPQLSFTKDANANDLVWNFYTKATDPVTNTLVFTLIQQKTIEVSIGYFNSYCSLSVSDSSLFFNEFGVTFLGTNLNQFSFSSTSLKTSIGTQEMLFQVAAV